MIRLITLLLVPTLLALAIACDDGDDGSAPAPTQTETPMASPEPPTPNGAPDEGAQFSGSASIDSEALFDGATIVAQVNGNNCGSGFVTDSSYELTVASDEAKRGCGTPGATVTFVLGGEGDPGGSEADESGIWDDGQVNELDITFTTLAPPPPPPNGASDEGAQFSGTATIDGVPLPDNHPGVGAQVNGNNCGSGFVTDGSYELTVASDEAKGGCGRPGDTVVFVLLGEGDPGGTEAGQTGTWDDSQANEVDITFTTE